MRKQVLKTLATISFLIAIAVVPVRSAQGQSLVYGLRVNIPFDFIVADKQFPAGEYVISRLRHYSNDSVLTISSVNGRAQIVRLTTAVQTLDPRDDGRVVFHRYGEQHFLFQVWPAGTSTGRAFTKSRLEREAAQRVRNIARDLTEESPATETVTIVGGPR